MSKTERKTFNNSLPKNKMDKFKPFFISALFLIISSLLVESRNILDETEKSGFIRLGSRVEHRSKRSVGDDRGAQNVYYVSRTPAVWGTAWLTCRQAMNGDLLTIETKAEDLFIRDLLIENHIATVWTSGAHDPDLGIWRWVATGGEVAYTNWLAGQPAGPVDISTRIAVQNSLFSLGWKTESEITANFYICEVRSDPVPQPTPSPPPTTPAPETTTAVLETTTYTHIDPPPEFVSQEVTGMPALN